MHPTTDQVRTCQDESDIATKRLLDFGKEQAIPKWVSDSFAFLQIGQLGGQTFTGKNSDKTWSSYGGSVHLGINTVQQSRYRWQEGRLQMSKIVQKHEWISCAISDLSTSREGEQFHKTTKNVRQRQETDDTVVVLNRCCQISGSEYGNHASMCQDSPFLVMTKKQPLKMNDPIPQ